MKNTTLKDLSKVLNISVSGVSKALKGYKDISVSTREEVLRMAQEMNYIPNSSAINLKTKQSKTIGLIIPSIVNQFFSKVLTGVIEEAEKQGYLVITLQSNDNFELEKSLFL
jgi:LacI family transcriptional regulator